LSTNAHISLGVYEHFSGHRYQVIGFGHQVTGDGATEYPGAEVVIYRAMFTSVDFGEECVWVRSVSNFAEDIDIGGRLTPRFRYVGAAE
jgi:hypothetical protein